MVGGGGEGLMLLLWRAKERGKVGVDDNRLVEQGV